MPRRQIVNARQRAALFDLPTDRETLLRHYNLLQSARMSARQRLENPELDLDGLTSVGFVRDFSSEIASAITGGKQDNFRNPDSWLSFLEELTIEFDLEDIPYSESGAYILSQLFWHHFTTFRLLTAWLIVDAFGRRLGEGGLSISLQGAGTLLSDLSGGGPPVFDVENMRGNFPDTYR